MKTLTNAEKASVREAKHFKIHDYPNNWLELKEYANFSNSRGQLCGFVEIEVGNAQWYLTTTVY
jgi:hypothetical protein